MLKMEDFFVFILSMSLLRSNIAIKAIECSQGNYLNDFVVQLTGSFNTDYLRYVDDYSGTLGTKTTIYYNVKINTIDFYFLDCLFSSIETGIQRYFD